MMKIYWFSFPTFMILMNSPIFFFNSLIMMKNWVYFFFPVTFILLMMINYFYFNYNLKTEKKATNNFYFFILIIMLLCFTTENNFTFLFMFELSLITIIILISNLGKDKDKIVAVFFMLLMNTVGSIPFMLSIYYFNLTLNTFSLNYMINMNWMINMNSMFQFFMLNLIFFFKLPMITFHFWLTKAHVSASGPSSMVLASMMLKLASIGMLKLSFKFLYLMNKLIPILSFFMIMSAIMVPLFMIRSFDLKYMVALSSIIHMSIIPLLCYIFNKTSMTSSVMMMVSHGLISSMMFFLVTLIYENSNNRSMEFSKSMESINKTFSMMLIFFILMNFGLPPIISFLTEILSLYSMMKLSMIITTAIVMSMVLTNTIFMFFSSKFLMGKKKIMEKNDTKISFMNISMENMKLLIILPFML